MSLEIDLLEQWDAAQRPQMAIEAAKADFLTPDGAVVLDIGANTGVWTEEFLKLKPSGFSIMFEPVPKYANWAANKLSNKASSTYMLRCALGAADEKLQIYMDDVNWGWNTLYPQENMEQMEIVVCALDTLELGISSVDFIKIDVEGTEWAVIAGMHHFLEGHMHLPPIQMEIGWGHVNHPDWDAEVEMLSYLDSIGYQIETEWVALEATTNILILPDSMSG